MANRSRPVSDRTFPWFQSGFDLEGIVGFLAAWLLGILLGMLWGPLFWLAFIPGIVLLFATRTAERVTPENSSLIVTPCDGVVVSVEEADAPDELRMPGPVQRIRISSSPFSSNNIHSPIAGTVDHLVREEGAAEAFAAMKPDNASLEQLFFAINGEPVQVGLRIATGGLGPRLETRTDAGDRVVAGKTIATRRLGGWCDVYLPLEGRVMVEPGRTLIGGETTLLALGDLVDSSFETPEPAFEAEDPTPETVPPEVAEDVEEDVAEDEAPPTPETTPPEVAEEVEDDIDSEDLDPDDPRRSDPAEMFARLRRQANKIHGEDDTSKDE
ncbi:MAG: hypothetical protein RIB03_14250 [Henriciella sp.]|uniref:phosphatidylserine decarboxylase n=1 Tax=Henriciella sp. TaxID=1968823 RepID=UPI0032EB4E13